MKLPEDPKPMFLLLEHDQIVLGITHVQAREQITCCHQAYL